MKNSFFLRRIMAALLAALAVLSAVSCRNGDLTEKPSESQSESQSESPYEKDTADYSEDAPVLSGLDTFEISYDYGPHGEYLFDETVIADIAAAGFTSVPIEIGITPEDARTILPLFKKYGLTCSGLRDTRISDIVKMEEPTQEKIDARVKEIVGDYAEFDNIEGWWIYYTPSAKLFDTIGMVVDAFRRFDPESETYIRLFQRFMWPERLGTADFEEYIDKFIETVKPDYLCYENFYFSDDGPIGGYFTTVEMIRKKGIEAGIDQMAILLLTYHNEYANLTKEQILYEVNMSLVYGFKRISYYSYWLDERNIASADEYKWSNSCVAYDGRKYQHYYDVTEINGQIYPLGVELASKESVAVFHIPDKDNPLSDGCTLYKGYGALGGVDGKNFVIGFFNDGSFMIVNNFYSGSADNEMVLLEQTAQLEYFDTASSSWKALDGADFAERNESGQYVLSFGSSEGYLFRVAK